MVFFISFIDALFPTMNYEIYEFLSWHKVYMLCNLVELNQYM